MRHHMTETCQWPQASSSTGSRVQAGRDDLDPPPEVGSRPGGVPALQQKKDKRKRREEEEQSRIHIVFWDRRLLGLGDSYLRLSFLVAVQRTAAFQSGQWAGQSSFLAAFRQGSAIFLAFSGQQDRRRCQVGGRHLPSVSYGQAYQQTYSDTGDSESLVLAHLDR